jgi:hypothetical protein
MGAGASSSPWLDEKALRGAAMRGDAQEVKQLVLDCSVPPDATQPSDGRTPLIFACLKGHAEVCRLLVAELGASVNLSDFYGVTPLMCASSNGHESLLKLLAAELDADVNADARLGQQQALLLARERGHDPVDNPVKKARSTLDDGEFLSSLRSEVCSCLSFEYLVCFHERFFHGRRIPIFVCVTQQ